MTPCPTCGQPLPDAHAGHVVPEAGPDVASDEQHARHDWVSVGRFRNLAEVGYFCDLFTSHKIPSQTRQHDEFRATDGSWRSIYVLQVPDERSAQAVELIKSEIAEDDVDADSVPWSLTDLPESVEAATNGLARLALLVVVVGGLAFLAGRAGPDRRAAVAPAGPTLCQTLAEIDGPLTTDAAAEGTPHRVRFDPGSGTLLIERDTDGDGRFERWRQYEEGQLAAD
jgi:hypothetical protein